jgi:hypothetical protein
MQLDCQRQLLRTPSPFQDDERAKRLEMPFCSNVEELCSDAEELRSDVDEWCSDAEELLGSDIEEEDQIHTIHST